MKSERKPEKAHFHSVHRQKQKQSIMTSTQASQHPFFSNDYIMQMKEKMDVDKEIFKIRESQIIMHES